MPAAVVIEALDEESLSRGHSRALADDGVESIAVCLLHSYKNPAHEVSVGREASWQQAGDLPVTLSQRGLARAPRVRPALDDRRQRLHQAA